MSYYGNSRNNNNWKNNQHDDQTIDISSGQPPTNEFETEFYRKTPVSSATANVVTKQYNDILERQGIPTITPEDFQILRECGRESLFYRCKLFFFSYILNVELELHFNDRIAYSARFKV